MVLDRVLSRVATTVATTFVFVMPVTAFAQAKFNLQNVLNLGAFGLEITGTGAGKIGGSASSIAYDGTNLYIGAWNSTSATGNVGIAKISDAFTSPSASILSGSVRSTVSQRGYTALKFDSQFNQLYAAWDNGTADTKGISAFSPVTGNVVWESGLATRGYGVGLDLLSGDVNNRVAFGTLFSGRRLLNNATNGANVYNTSNGLVHLVSGSSSNIRDLDLDEFGNVYTRAANNVMFTERTGANSGATPKYLVDKANNGTNSAGQNLAVHTAWGDTVVLYNDRPNTLGDRNQWANAMRVVRLDGTELTTEWKNSDGTAPVTIDNGNGWYDMQFLPSGELVVVDYLNSYVYQWQMTAVPEPTTALLAIALIPLLKRKRKNS